MTPNESPSANGAYTPAEERIVDRLRSLPPEATALVEDFCRLMAAHFGDPSNPAPPAPLDPAAALTGEPFARVVRALPPDAARQILEYAVFVAGKHLKWSYDDPASLSLAADLMGLDPFLQRESAAISRDFEPTLNDGLEAY